MKKWRQNELLMDGNEESKIVRKGEMGKRNSHAVTND
jgi:hypothetical protein